MDWIQKGKEVPEKRRRILVYSPIYKEIDETILYRIMDSGFLHIATDVEYWMYLDPPEKENK